jgi:hypothetical protein
MYNLCGVGCFCANRNHMYCHRTSVPQVYAHQSFDHRSTYEIQFPLYWLVVCEFHFKIFYK